MRFATTGVFTLLEYSRSVLPQIIHPFYIFQIASIVLWTLDDYYYYAFCIALISAVSIVTTLVDTKKVGFFVRSWRTDKLKFVLQTIARMREMSRFSCPVNVLIDGACEPSPYATALLR